MDRDNTENVILRACSFVFVNAGGRLTSGTDAGENGKKGCKTKKAFSDSKGGLIGGQKYLRSQPGHTSQVT